MGSTALPRLRGSERRRSIIWGDIDTHGFAILDRLRAFFPYAQSFLMDRTTLMAHRELWGRERDRYERPLSRLTIPEQVLFEELKDGLLGDRVRLEQERISFGWLSRHWENCQPSEPQCDRSSTGAAK